MALILSWNGLHWDNLVGYRLFACVHFDGIHQHDAGVELLFAGQPRPVEQLTGSLTISDAPGGTGYANRAVFLTGLQYLASDTAGACSLRRIKDDESQVDNRSCQLVRLAWNDVNPQNSVWLDYRHDRLPASQPAVHGQLGFTCSEANNVTQAIANLPGKNQPPAIQELNPQLFKPVARFRKAGNLFAFMTSRTQHYSWLDIARRQTRTNEFGLNFSCRYVGAPADQFLHHFSWSPTTQASEIFVEELYGAFVTCRWDHSALASNNVAAWSKNHVEELRAEWDLFGGGVPPQNYGADTVERVTFRS